eukprot:4958566-Alexandrium_andersonii.AAC.1
MPTALAKTAVAASREANWLTVDGDERPISHDQGSIPGDPWGDLFYGLLQARVRLGNQGGHMTA